MVGGCDELGGEVRTLKLDRIVEVTLTDERFQHIASGIDKVFANAWFYRHRLSGHAGSFREMLGAVPGRSGEAEGRVASIVP